MKNHLIKFINDERGQSTTEYILILAVVVMIAMKFKSVFLEQLQGLLTSVSRNINEAATGGGN